MTGLETGVHLLTRDTPTPHCLIHVCTPVSMLVIMEYDAMSLQWQVILH